MTTPTEQILGKLVHVARIYTSGKWNYLYLRKNPHRHFTWHEEKNGLEEAEAPVSGSSVEEAMRLALKHWKNSAFNTLICGFRYTLPERDEHGINALFHQMAASYSVSSGVYYDEELGNNCFVQSASEEALKLFQRLKVQNRLT
jgi:hypothetical protein